ncbi:ribonuclease [bacterium]|nr:ribonuclease [bacterium]
MAIVLHANSHAVPWRLRSHTAAAFLCVLCALAPLAVRAQYDPPPAYYDAASGLTGPALKAALHGIIAPHRVKSYDDARWILHALDGDPDDLSLILLVYSGYSVSGAWDGGVTWNREHLWPQSRGVTASPANSDLFNLRPCNPAVNSSRGNKWFDNGGTPPAYPLAPECAATATTWQPRPVEQGDIARALFYMDTRYDGSDPGTPDLQLVNTAPTGCQMAVLFTLVQWHFDDPVSETERRRNHLIFTDWQTNRNPYVDHPEYVPSIYGVPEPACLLVFAALVCAAPGRGWRLPSPLLS